MPDEVVSDRTDAARSIDGTLLKLCLIVLSSVSLLFASSCFLVNASRCPAKV